MKKMLTLALLAALFATPALANEAKMDAKADHYFAKMDGNGDGKITEAEHTAFADKMFNDADTNNDDALSKDELKAHKMKEKKEVKGDMKDKDHE